jgi:tRNA A-37 threonylcarbamoyl transferase component Bud32
MRMQVLAARTSGWAAASAHADQSIDSTDFRLLKRTARTIAGFLEVDGTPVFIKRVDEGSWLKGWILRLRGSRARRVLRGAAILDAAGFARPEPLALTEARSMGAIRASYMISETLGDARIMSQVVLAGGRRNFRRRCGLSAVIAKEIRRLHDAGIYTRDLQETNLMLAGGDSTGWTVYFVDLEDFRWTSTVSGKRRMLNLVHLDRTIGRFLPRTQRLRFLYNYLGKRPGRTEARRLVNRFFAIRERAERRARSHRRTSGVIAPKASADTGAAANL